MISIPRDVLIILPSEIFLPLVMEKDPLGSSAGDK